MLSTEKTTAIQMSSASMSLLASSAITAMIAHPRNGGLSSPYRRIIFGLSMADALQSFGFFTGPFFVPSEGEFNRLAVGNDETCKANGFLITIGANAVPMYTCALCFYYFCKLKLRMTDIAFRDKFEIYFHLFIPLFNLIVASAALGLGAYNPTLSGTYCHFASIPRGCRYFPDWVGECDPVIEKHVNNLTLIISTALPFLYLFIIAFLMIMLYWHAITWNRIFRQEYTSTPTPVHVPTSLRPSSVINDNDEEENNRVEEQSQSQNQSTSRQNVEHLSRLYRRESLIQATCWVGSFVIVHVPVLTIYVLILRDTPLPESLLTIAITFYPLGGLFNILVYARPNVAGLRRNHPEYSRILALWLVLKSGGEIPDDEDNTVPTAGSKSLCCCGGRNNDDDPQSFPIDIASVRTPSFRISDDVSSAGVIPQNGRAGAAATDMEGADRDRKRNRDDSTPISSSVDRSTPSKYRYYHLPPGMFDSDAEDKESRQLRLDNCPVISSRIDSSHIGGLSSRGDVSSFSNFGTSTASLAVVVEEENSQGEVSEDGDTE